jgi:hypothetical protein
MKEADARNASHAGAAPLHLLVHERDERLDIAITQRVVGRPDRVGRHRLSVRSS